ncbi:tape measure protein [Haloimpatiens sp. FM7315]|uniref:tape measure protein n=1 Tax=Haloimpatiens sp. FM7315 TaxID=3298609 RepID=UPI0035A2E823
MADGRIIIDTEINSSGAEKGVSKLSSKLGGIAKTGVKAFTGAVAATGVALGGLGAIGFKYNSDMEQYMAGFTTMLGSADKASKHMNELKTFAAKTPFEMSDLAQASTTLQAFGVDIKEVTPDLKMLGDISLGNKEKFNGLALVFGQVKSQGKLMGQDLMQMINNGFNPLQIISEKTGKSMSQLKDEMSKGQISYEMVADAMKTATSEGGMFCGAMDKQSNTMTGLLSTLKDNLGALAGKLATPIFKLVKKGLEDFIPVLDNASAAVDMMFKKMDEGKSIGYSMREAFKGIVPEDILLNVTTIIDGINFAIKGLVAFIQGDVEKARDMFYTMFPTDDIGNEKYVDIIIGVLDTIKGLFNFIKNNFQEVISAVLGVGVAIGTFNLIMKASQIIGVVTKLISAYRAGTLLATLAQLGLNTALLSNPFTWVAVAISALVGGIVYLWNTNEGFRSAVIGAWDTILGVGKAVWGWLVNFFTVDIPNAFQVVIDFFVGIPDWFVNLWTNIKQAFLDGWQAITNFFTETIPTWIEQMFNWFNELPGKIGYALGYALGTIVKWGIDTWNYLVTNVPKWIAAIVKFFSELPGKIWTWLVNTISKIVAWGQQTYSNMVNAAAKAINAVIQWFTTLPSRIWQWLYNTISKIIDFGRNLGSKAAEAGSNMVTNIINAVKNLPNKMMDVGKNVVKGVWEGIVGMASWLKSKVSDFFGSIVNGAKDALGIHSPSRVFRDQVGKYMAQGVGVGFSEETKNIQNSMNKKLSTLTAKMRATVDYETSKTSRTMASKFNGAMTNTVTNNNDNGVTQNVTIVNPERTPSENARALKRVGRDLALGY